MRATGRRTASAVRYSAPAIGGTAKPPSAPAHRSLVAGTGGLAATLAKSGKRAQRRHVAARELPPVRQHRRQNRADLVGAQPQQSVSRALCERLLQSRAEIELQRRDIAGWP